jgi:hypothetical protein
MLTGVGPKMGPPAPPPPPRGAARFSFLPPNSKESPDRVQTLFSASPELPNWFGVVVVRNSFSLQVWHGIHTRVVMDCCPKRLE